jgi:hypothetical protein
MSDSYLSIDYHEINRDDLLLNGIQDCDLEMESPYNRSKDAFMSDGELRFDNRLPYQYGNETIMTSQSLASSP